MATRAENEQTRIIRRWRLLRQATVDAGALAALDSLIIESEAKLAQLRRRPNHPPAAWTT